MANLRERVLAYNRIASNKRNTKLLIAGFAVVLTPALSAATILFLPWIAFAGAALAYGLYGRSIAGRLDELDRQLTASSPARFFDLPPTVLWIIGGLLLIALVIVLVVMCIATAYLIFRYGSRLMLRAARAVPANPQRDRDLVRVVENLSIAAGLPTPSVHVVESNGANAFATGPDPDHASLVVTRGLLALLNRRELEGVVAHELSHIGNHDIRLTTTLAALTAIVTAPIRLVGASIRFAFGIHFAVGTVLVCLVAAFAISAINGAVELASMSRDVASLREMPMFLRGWGIHALLSPIYAVFIAPILAGLARLAVARQREFLADADAVLLTRDPEGFALALAKIGNARGERLRVGEASVHLYLVDPLEDSGSWWHRLFPSHPPLKARIDMLLRMGSGIQSSEFAAALTPPASHPSQPAHLVSK